MGADSESPSDEAIGPNSRTTLLVPIRYPLTDDSARTLAAGGRLASERAPANLVVLHVDLLHRQESTKTAELARAIDATLEGVATRVTTRQGILVEREIVESVRQWDADAVVLGERHDATWRRYLRRLFRREQGVANYLSSHVPPGVEVLEVDPTDEIDDLDAA
jgi:K+-sensing histidine kinase KdpD